MKRACLAIVGAAQSLPVVVERWPLALPLLRRAAARAGRYVRDMFKAAPVTVRPYLGWCTRSRLRAPTDCFFFEVTNAGNEPVSVEKIGVTLQNGRDIFVEHYPPHPPLPYRVESRQRRVFSVTIDELTEEVGRHWVETDIVAVVVSDGSGALWRARVPHRIRERLRTEYLSA